jgi:hypothetical protein
MTPKRKRLGSAATAVAAGLLTAAAVVTSLGARGTSPLAGAVTESPSAGVPSASPSLVPWLALQAPIPAPATPSAPSSPPCNANDVAFSPPSSPGFGLGSEYFGAVVSLRSSFSCWLPGSPSATFIDASGTAIAIAAEQGGPGSPPVTLTPRTRSATIMVQISDYQALPAVASLALVLGDGSHLVLPVTGVSSGTGPGPESEAVYVVSIAAPALASPTAVPSMGGVGASLTASGPAIPGHPYDFEITLSNSSDSPVPLSPCPTYEEGLKGASASVSAYLLNCAAGKPIAPDSAETFAIRILIPSSTPPRQHLLTWGIFNSVGAYANSEISVL